MKKEYIEPQIEIKRFSIENIILSESNPIETTVSLEIGGEVDPGSGDR